MFSSRHFLLKYQYPNGHIQGSFHIPPPSLLLTNLLFMNRIVIAGVQSGVGKTTVTLGLMAALVRRGMRVSGFKVGPDYLDPTYYRQITGRKAYNLDGWMTSKRYVRTLFSKAASDSNISVVEGVMGLYDGFGALSEEGSTAQIAKWLKTPVVLVVNARGMSRSVVALLKGYIQFDRRVNLCGVIFNNLGSERHLDLLKTTVSENLHLPVLGGLLRDESIRLPDRHLGLIPATEGGLNEKILKSLTSQIENQVDLDSILSMANGLPSFQNKPLKPAPPQKKKICTIAVACDDAFNFYYEDNFSLLEEAGAKIVCFSPIRDTRLPDGIDGLFLGGGYPECFSEQLASNKSMLNEVREFGERGRPIYAECGGLVYLSESIQLKDGNVFPMTGLIPVQCRMLEKRKALGYVEVKIKENSIIGKKEMSFRGHEFHYSSVTQVPSNMHFKYSVLKRDGKAERPEGFSYKNVLGSYIHAHFASQPGIARNLVKACSSPG